MADWKVTVPINLPLDTIMAIHNDESIEAALSDFADSDLKGHAVVHDVVRAIIDTVNGSAYRITCDSKSKMPPATYSHPTSRTAKEHEAYDSLSTPKGSFRSQQTLGQDDSVKKGGWSSPLHIHIVIRSTVNKDEHFYVTPDITIASLSNSYVARTTVSGKCYRLKHEVWGMTTEFLDMNATIKQAGLKNDAILVAVGHLGKPVTVTFKDAMLCTHIVESDDETMIKTLLLSYADDTGHDLENLVFVVNGKRELRETDYGLTLFDLDIEDGSLITVRPWDEKPKYIKISLQDPLGYQQTLTIREDARISTLRSQYERSTGYKADYLSFDYFPLSDEQQLRRIGIGEGSIVEVHRTPAVPKSEFAAPSCPPTSPSLFAPSRVLSNSYVPAASYSGWDYTPCPRSKRWSEWGWN